MNDLVDLYGKEHNGVRLIALGTVETAGGGCVCPENTMLRMLLMDLVLAKKDVVILDMEAGVEHFGRGTDNSVDGILMIVDPSFESLRLSAKIADLSRSIGKPIWFCLNKLTEENVQMMEEEVRKHGKIICHMPLNHELSLAGLTGAELQMTISPISEMAAHLIR